MILGGAKLEAFAPMIFWCAGYEVSTGSGGDRI